MKTLLIIIAMHYQVMGRDTPRFHKGDTVQIKGERRYIYIIDSISHRKDHVKQIFYHGTDPRYGWVQPFLPEKSIKLYNQK